jgi:hypothetical protein
VLNFTGGGGPPCAMNRRLGKPHNRLDISGKRKSLVPSGIRIADNSARSLDAIRVPHVRNDGKH